METEQVSTFTLNEATFTPRGCVIRYKSKGLAYLCNCCLPLHVLPTHVTWMQHLQSSLDHVVRYECDHCSSAFSNIRSVAQHAKSCKQPECEPSKDIVVRPIEPHSNTCPFCAYQTRFKRGLSRHLHRKHAQELFEKYSRHRLKDSRWTGCEFKSVAKIMYRQLVSRGLVNNTTNARLVLRDSYKLCRDRIAKSYRQVKLAFYSRDLQQALDKIANRKRLKEQSTEKPTFYDSKVSCNEPDQSCDCFDKVRQVIRTLIANLKMPMIEKRTKQLCQRELNSQSALKGTKLLDVIYRKYGDPHKGYDLARSCSSRNLNTLSADELYTKLKSKGYVNHLCNPELLGLEPTEAAKQWFSGQFARPSINDEHPFIARERANVTCSIHAPINIEEVEMHVKSFDKHTACGNDRFSAVNLKSTPAILLAILMNLFILARNVPLSLKANRTTLLAKKPNPGDQDWRPITVSSVIYRLFSKIVTQRLTREVYLSPHQRAFLPGIDGCGENASVIAMLIRDSNAGHGPLYMCSIDLAKAFDSVSFSSINRALMRQGVDQISLSLIENLLLGNFTVVGGSMRADITRGVRQGDPISPLLFNLVIDELFDYLRDSKRGAFYLKRNGLKARIGAVAFADDIVLLCDSQRHLEKQLSCCVRFFTNRGMKINISKSSCLAIRKLPNSEVCTPLPVIIKVKNPATDELELLPCLGPTSELRILGTYVTPLGKPDIQMGRLRELLELISNSDIKQSHKVDIIRTHVVFKFRYQVVYGGVNLTDAGSADSLIRKYLRSILGLPNHAADAFFHLPLSLGGLGIERLESAATYLRVKTELRLLHSTREVTEESVRVGKLRDAYLRCNKDLAILLESEEDTWRSIENPELLASKLKAINADEWYDRCRKYQNIRDLRTMRELKQGTAFFHLPKAPNTYLSRPTEFNLQVDKIPLIYQIRLGMLNTLSNSRGARNREGEPVLRCRLCKNATETPAHVLQKCRRTKRWQHERHNSIVKLLESKLITHLNGEHGSVHREQQILINCITSQNEVRFKPDLIAVYRNTMHDGEDLLRVAVIDVTITYEQSVSSMSKAYERKRNKYETLRGHLLNRTNLEILASLAPGETLCTQTGPRSIGVRFKVFPIVIGTRGSWLKSNTKLLNFLGIREDKVLVNRIMRTAAERSVNIFKKFMGKVRTQGVESV